MRRNTRIFSPILRTQEIIAEGDSLEFEASDAAPTEEAPAKEAGQQERKEDSELDKIMSKVEVLRISQVSSDDVELGALRVSIAGLAWEEPRECSYLEMPMGVVRDLPARVMIGGCS